MNKEYRAIVFEDENEVVGRHFSFDENHQVVNYFEVAVKILLCLRDNPVTGMPYYSDPTKEFSATLSTKYNRKDNIRRKAILFTTTKGGKGSKWKLDDKSLQHMLETGQKYGLEGLNDTKGTYHAHALEPVINYFIETPDIDLSITDFEFRK